MNANTIINDTMTLDEQLAAIATAVENAQKQAEDEAKAKGVAFVPSDPALLTICDGCE